MVDVPDGGLEDISEVIIYGVESEQIEEENDAYNDLRAELGKQCNLSHGSNSCQYRRNTQGGRR